MNISYAITVCNERKEIEKLKAIIATDVVSKLIP